MCVCAFSYSSHPLRINFLFVDSTKNGSNAAHTATLSERNYYMHIRLFRYLIDPYRSRLYGAANDVSKPPSRIPGIDTFKTRSWNILQHFDRQPLKKNFLFKHNISHYKVITHKLKKKIMSGASYCYLITSEKKRRGLCLNSSPIVSMLSDSFNSISDNNRCQFFVVFITLWGCYYNGLSGRSKKNVEQKKAANSHFSPMERTTRWGLLYMMGECE